MHCPPQGSRSFAVDDTDVEDAVFSALFEVIRDQGLDFNGKKGVQVKDAVDGENDGFALIHDCAYG